MRLSSVGTALLLVMLVWGAPRAEAAPPYAALQSFAVATRQAAHFVDGHAGPRLYVYFDPNCIYCHLLYERLQPYVAGGQVRVAWIPVGFLKSDSPGKAEAILGAPDPRAAMSTNEQRFDRAQEEGGVAPLAHPPRALVRKVYENTRLLAALGNLATPTLVFMDADGVVHVMPGMPAHVGTLIAALGPFH